jgi:Flp pilus assembly protein CpaB
LNSRKPLVLIAAAVVAIIAVVVLYMYVNGQKDRAFKNAEMVNVWVVHEKVEKGTYGQSTQGQIVKDQIPRKFYPSNAIKDTTQITNKVAVADLAVNTIVVEGMFADPATQQVTLSTQLKPIRDVDQVALTISVTNVQGVAGLIVPGDFVNIMVTNLASQPLGEGGAGGGSGGGAAAGMCGDTPIPDGAQASDYLFCQQAVVLMQKVEVLAVGTNAVPTPGASTGTETTTPPTDTGLLTFIVPMESAQMIASVPPGNFYLALVAKDYSPTPTKRIEPNAPLPSENPEQLTPYGPDGPT